MATAKRKSAPKLKMTFRQDEARRKSAAGLSDYGAKKARRNEKQSIAAHAAKGSGGKKRRDSKGRFS
jgi:hypothetical protein